MSCLFRLLSQPFPLLSAVCAITFVFPSQVFCNVMFWLLKYFSSLSLLYYLDTFSSSCHQLYFLPLLPYLACSFRRLFEHDTSFFSDCAISSLLSCVPFLLLHCTFSCSPCHALFIILCSGAISFSCFFSLLFFPSPLYCHFLLISPTMSRPFFSWGGPLFDSFCYLNSVWSR